MQRNNPVRYLGHEDFAKLLCWEIVEAVEGDYISHLLSYEQAKDVYGRLPPHLYRERMEFVKMWGQTQINRRHVCIDVETGEVYLPGVV